MVSTEIKGIYLNYHKSTRKINSKSYFGKDHYQWGGQCNDKKFVMCCPIEYTLEEYKIFDVSLTIGFTNVITDMVKCLICPCDQTLNQSLKNWFIKSLILTDLLYVGLSFPKFLSNFQT